MSDDDYGHWHTHSIVEDPYGRKLRHGRAFATKFRRGKRDVHFSAEWRVLPKRSNSFGWGVGVTIGCPGDEDDLKLSLHASWLGDLWLHGSGFMPRRWMPKGYNSRVIRVGVSAERIQIDLWAKEHEWSRKDPWWMHNYWFTERLLFGKATHSKTELESGSCVIPMPEGLYDAFYTVEQATWTYPRRPARHRLSITIEPVVPVPVPGKGENSWDLDDDAVFSMSVSGFGRDVNRAVASFVQSVTLTRLRHGGAGWQPPAPEFAK